MVTSHHGIFKLIPKYFLPTIQRTRLGSIGSRYHNTSFRPWGIQESDLASLEPDIVKALLTISNLGSLCPLVNHEKFAKWNSLHYFLWCNQVQYTHAWNHLNSGMLLKESRKYISHSTFILWWFVSLSRKEMECIALYFHWSKSDKNIVCTSEPWPFQNIRIEMECVSAHHSHSIRNPRYCYSLTCSLAALPQSGSKYVWKQKTW